MAKTSIIVEDNKQINRVNTHQLSVAAARTRCSAGIMRSQRPLLPWRNQHSPFIPLFTDLLQCLIPSRLPKLFPNRYIGHITQFLAIQWLWKETYADLGSVCKFAFDIESEGAVEIIRIY